LAGLLVLEALPLQIQAQEAQAPKLRIVILEGEGAINNIKKRTAREPIVQVEDENNRPVAGAMVMFRLPEQGAGGSFANGSKSIMAYTNADGRAVAVGLKPNATAGQFQISVQASYQGVTASAAITQTNIVAAAAAVGAAGATAGISKTLIAILAIAGGAAAAGTVAATRGGNGGSKPNPVPTPPSATINAPGTPSFSPPD
jgi:hypothetical protein